jgi:hypothetical protein
MSHKFKVGDKARVRFSYFFPELKGSELTITEQLRPRRNHRTNKKWLGIGTDLICPDGTRFTPDPEQLEPIIDEKASRREIDQVVPWSDMPWKPVGVTA